MTRVYQDLASLATSRARYRTPWLTLGPWRNGNGDLAPEDDVSKSLGIIDTQICKGLVIVTISQDTFVWSLLQLSGFAHRVESCLAQVLTCLQPNAVQTIR